MTVLKIAHFHTLRCPADMTFLLPKGQFAISLIESGGKLANVHPITAPFFTKTRQKYCATVGMDLLHFFTFE